MAGVATQMQADGGELLAIRRVTKAYGQPPQKFVALEEISLSVGSGEFVCLLGPSGCGKSTLLRIIAGLTAATGGTISYQGQPVEGINPHTTIVFQSFALYPWLTVQENVEIALKARGVPLPGRRQQATRLIDMVGLDGFETAYPRELSGGMRQKVGFARAMAVEPELLCLDEPFSALDVLSAEALRGELLELWLSRLIPTRAILMVTHNIEEAVLMADRIVVMEKEPGCIVADERVHLRHPRHRKDTAFQAIVDKIYAIVVGRTEPEGPGFGATPGQPGPRAKLPRARINALAGLMETLAASKGHIDVPVLAEVLGLELDDLLPVVEAAELLGFAQVAEGDIHLTPLGQTFADASILARKEIISGRILRQPTVAWIFETLQLDDDKRVAEEYFLDRLAPDFGDESQDQLSVAIQWGRHAELFAFDDDTDELYLET